MPKPNGFALFISEQRRANPRLKDKSFEEIAKEVDHLWRQMSQREKEDYQVRAKGPRPRTADRVNNNVPDKEAVLGGYDAIGRSLVEIERQNRQRDYEKDQRRLLVKDIVDEGKKRQNFVDDVFFVMHVNIFVRTPDTNVVVPAEISLAKFSFKSGLMGSYQAFINPGDIPAGYKYKCIERSQLEHKIPIYLDTDDSGLAGSNSTELKRQDDKDIVLDITKFLGGVKTVFTMEAVEEDCQDVLETLCQRAGMNSIGLQLVRLSDLLFHLVDDIPFVSVAEAEFVKERFLYEKGLACAWHESETESHHCSQAYAKRWTYILLAFSNDIFKVAMVDDGKHAPLGSLNMKDGDDIDNVWDVVEEPRMIRPHDKNSIFASSDIRYRETEEDNKSQSIFTTTGTDLASSAAVSNVGSEVEFESAQEQASSLTPAGSQASLVSSTVDSKKGALLQTIRNQRTSSRMVAKF